MAFFHLFTTVKELRLCGSFARQVARALEDVPVTEVCITVSAPLLFETTTGGWNPLSVLNAYRLSGVGESLIGYWCLSTIDSRSSGP